MFRSDNKIKLLASSSIIMTQINTNTKKTLDKSKCLASLAVFREIYNSEKDVYGIISEFLVEIIISHSKHSFGLTEITNILNQTYDFNIPEAVVKTSLKRIRELKRDNNIYSIDSISKLKTNKIDEKKENIHSSNKQIITGLISFIEEKNKTKLTSIQKSTLVDSFCSFLIDTSNEYEFSEFISAYILKNENDLIFQKQLKTIKEGVVLYTGIKYSSDLSSLGSWKTEITIFVDTEILFHFAGLNGEVYQALFEDFYSYVKEINSKKSRLIKLRYFREVRQEIENFFEKAKYIVEGNDRANPRITAMRSIINGCGTKADVLEKKAKFFQLLEKNGILEDTYDSYAKEENHKHNIIEKELVDKIQIQQAEEIYENVKFLNYVSIQRKDRLAINFENIGFILLTGNSKTLKSANNSEILIDKNSIPLAIDLSFITNKFWFILNKGFGDNNFPKTFDVITKAQMVLSSQLNKSVGKKYDELQQKLKSGELTEDDAKATIIELRKEIKKPEEINSKNADSLLDCLSESNLERYIKEHEHLKIKVELREKENICLRSQIIEKEEKLLSEKRESLAKFEESKEIIDLEIKKAFNFLKLKVFGGYFVLYFIGCLYIYFYGWDKFEKWTWIIGLFVLSFVPLLYFLATEKTLNISDFLKKQRIKIQEEKYRYYKLDFSLSAKLQDEIGQIEKNIRESLTEIKKFETSD